MNALEQRLEAEREIPLSRYQEDGYDNRVSYLRGLAGNYGLEFDDVLAVLEFLPPNEDFDGLPATLEDMQMLGGGTG